jgi:hypothetical protein
MRQNNLLHAVEMVDAIILERYLKLDRVQVAQLRKAEKCYSIADARAGRAAVARIDDLLQTALKGLPIKPDDSAKQPDKKR